jgi:hypothetical protein
MPANDGAMILPDMDTHAVYCRAIERQRQLYGLLLG